MKFFEIADMCLISDEFEAFQILTFLVDPQLPVMLEFSAPRAASSGG
jgi:hypothetical protein